MAASVPVPVNEGDDVTRVQGMLSILATLHLVLCATGTPAEKFAKASAVDLAL